ncbi:chloride channel CLIC-like protein 1 [Strongylocentrotus purpuratus]|uniref:Chloride channel CLIC-like protein 1 n=1 Tax=Strongylocentrotus purpuratus TaxID=7668 RepID=A0A7M7PIN3_STRPU|nr:chloride channel CLIC-like protein 1 [Strongylocentrotus purpuratus]
MSSDIFFNRRSLAVIVVFIFVWNWIYFYQEENNHALNLIIPANCMPHKMTWVQALQEWFSSMTSIRTDECFEYYRIPLIRALSRTVNLFFIDTFRYIGQAIYECHEEILRDQPTHVGISALTACYGIGTIAVYFSYVLYISAEETTSTGSYPVTGFPNDIRSMSPPTKGNVGRRLQPRGGATGAR